LGKLFPLAFAVVDAENNANWRWFLETLHTIVEQTVPDFVDPTNIDNQLTFLSDRQKGLCEGVQTLFPQSSHGFCILHLIRNFRVKFKNPVLKILIWKAAKATTKEDYDEAISNTKGIDPASVVWLQTHSPSQHWAEIYFPGKRYGHYTLNIAESLNSWLLQARDLPIMPMIEAIRHKMMELFEERRRSDKDTAFIVSTVAEKIQSAKVLRARQCRYLASSDTLYKVLSMRTNNQYLVDLEKGTCSCREWQALGYPCHHAIAVMMGRQDDPELYVRPFFTLPAFRATYSGHIVSPRIGDFTAPLDPNDDPDIQRIQRGIAAHNTLNENDRDVVTIEDMIEIEASREPPAPAAPVLLPPKTRRPPGRPKKQRHRSGGEHVAKRIQHCTCCGLQGLSHLALCHCHVQRSRRCGMVLVMTYVAN
jgi:MULE transposase domain/SWIM zinc finger